MGGWAEKEKSSVEFLVLTITFFPDGRLIAMPVKTVVLAGDQRRKPDHSD